MITNSSVNTFEGIESRILYRRADGLFNRAVGVCGVKEAVETSLSLGGSVLAIINRRVFETDMVDGGLDECLTSCSKRVGIRRLPDGSMTVMKAVRSELVDYANLHVDSTDLTGFTPSSTGDRPFLILSGLMDVDDRPLAGQARLTAEVVFSSPLQTIKAF